MDSLSQTIAFSYRIFGTQDWAYLGAVLFFAFVGVLISLLRHTTNRKSDSTSSPKKFSFWYMLRDNKKRIFLNILLVLVTIRFCKEITGLELNEFYALLIGVFYDNLGEALQNKKILVGKKDN